MDDVSVSFGHGSSAALVLDRVTFPVQRGRTVGLVGESGSGKSTIAKVLVGVVRPDSGRVLLDGADLTRATRSERDRIRRRIQMIPQDPYSSLNPRATIGSALAEALDPRRRSVRAHRDEIVSWLEQVRLPADAIDRYPHQFSGGQRQRIAIARALMVGPEIVIADEITSALDVSVQAEILALVDGLRHRLSLTMIFISHNLAVVRQVSDEVAVIRRGVIVEHSPAEEVFTAPRHPYTRALLDAVPGSPTFSLD